ncbi:hypothetical protein FB567DRAFT_134598 [Paraphoma chrysanthemicola]|uniref:Uncharacterized protein n=1 Tax=Paraphoma chrysanthemicola TaxID=798071 RepID=A0A8K0VUP9_9PLEO|nr:hypothetical protein FB567DRAFT_134598 [Paraphoma chrysanthemicola]
MKFVLFVLSTVPYGIWVLQAVIAVSTIVLRLTNGSLPATLLEMVCKLSAPPVRASHVCCTIGFQSLFNFQCGHLNAKVHASIECVIMHVVQLLFHLC